jgi:two-component system, OmpR family, KDP operon response regulator KdpE
MEMRKCVLIVDDEPSILRFARVSLQLAGFDVITVSSGEEAICQVKSGKPDVLVLDILMTPMDGFMVLREIREFSTIPVLAFTASRTAADNACDYGADDILLKPFPPEELIQKLQRLLDKKKLLK